MMWLPNTVENVLVQLAASFCGMKVVTVKTAQQIASLDDQLQCKGIITSLENHLTSGKAAPRTSIIPPILTGTAQLTGDFLRFDEMLTAPSIGHAVAKGETDNSFMGMYHYGTVKGVSEQKLLQMGEESGAALDLTSADRVCMPITLNHTFGFGSGVLGAIGRGAAVVLPSVASCSERTYKALATEQCTVLFADSHTLKALPQPAATPADQTLTSDVTQCTRGLVKIGSGDTIGCAEPRKWANAVLMTVGKPKLD
jgi:fatty-acyl-CoA synthase